ncbi:hypothetical protein KSC_019230 [Ktedonobacter sp. SOSP1-52]|nr:hypothetical protein KSC_019230 [Ktedonobacter sp. SOSP1-52]
MLDPFPVLAQPVIEIWTRGDLTMFQSPMPFVPRFCLHPAPSIRGGVFEEVHQILSQRWVIALRNQDVVSCQAMNLGAQFPLGMYGIEGEDTTTDP